MLTNNRGQSDIDTHKTNTEIKESMPNRLFTTPIYKKVLRRIVATLLICGKSTNLE